MHYNTKKYKASYDRMHVNKSTLKINKSKETEAKPAERTKQRCSVPYYEIIVSEQTQKLNEINTGRF